MDEEIKQDTPQAEMKLPDKPLDKMTAPELRDLAMEIPGVTGVHAMKKEELLAVIKEYHGIQEEEAPKRKKGVKTALPSPTELKAKIAGLRTAKETAREARDRKTVDIVRRRINRLKKMTRKAVQG
ncbi:hypothetical protein [Desulfatiglans anilini]|uniref:hypothetical protein n=1 Tax=Desulfatiglans anilini TaxID=90728 RepID=UPI0004253405|nr:hypothetical protein [Desulfatiglans anilini]